MSNEHYLHNPLVHQNRKRADGETDWERSFSCQNIKPLIICRGPIRKEAMDVFTEMGIDQYGILLSEKDSIVYQNALAPELRQIKNPGSVHRVPDYTGADKEERDSRIQQIIRIAKENGYNAIFAGYGFMAEDENMVSAMEQARLNFIGPCSRTVHDAGLKDEAKRTASKVGVSVTPGIDNATALTLLKKYKDDSALLSIVDEHCLVLDNSLFSQAETLAEKADQVLAAAYKKGIDLYSIEELQQTICEQVILMHQEYPDNRIRLKCIGGGGGKGQRILPNPSSFSGTLDEKIKQVADQVGSFVLEILNEVKATGQGDNKNILIELNIETTRHQEIQVIGNGDWSLALGGRDCSLQMHEQKLLEVSVITEDLENALAQAIKDSRSQEADILSRDIKTLQTMEEEAERFASAVGLDNVSTFECIVDRDKHFFMEMNTRIQVEHRVTELCYALKFTNPDNPNESFVVHSLVELMVLLAAHGTRLPKPERVLRHNASVEARLNATNQALAPHAGGVVEQWSDAAHNEIRDDQGISLHNPDTDVFMKYHLAGAYDSNIALLLTMGNSRHDSYTQLAEILRTTELTGKDLSTNLEFHYGLVNWFLGNNIHARPATDFIVPYLTAVGLLKQQADSLNMHSIYQNICESLLENSGKDQDSLATILERKQLLLTRPIDKLFAEPHILSGWLSRFQATFQFDNQGHITWQENPVKVLHDTYHFLHMEFNSSIPAAKRIWDHDHDILSQAVAFYSELEQRLNTDNFSELQSLLQKNTADGFTNDEWQAVCAAHKGYQAGNDVLLVLPYIGFTSQFFDLAVKEDLNINIPEALLDKDLQAQMAKVLAPPPVAKSDELLAPTGGMFYACEAPDLPPMMEEGSHFEAGQPLYIIEVMKMFNKVHASFSGTIDKVLIEEDGSIITKGQPIFKITPDEQVAEESEAEVQRRVQDNIAGFLTSIQQVKK